MSELFIDGMAIAYEGRTSIILEEVFLKGEKMEAAQDNLGICSTCIYVDTCVRRAAHNKPVWECNEFDDVPLELNKAKIIRPTGVSTENISETDSDQYLGLCKNCESRKTCKHPKPSGGVWHCEDYS